MYIVCITQSRIILPNVEAKNQDNPDIHVSMNILYALYACMHWIL